MSYFSPLSYIMCNLVMMRLGLRDECCPKFVVFNPKLLTGAIKIKIKINTHTHTHTSFYYDCPVTAAVDRWNEY